MDKIEYMKIDDLTKYVEQLCEKGAKTVVAKKTSRIAARQGNPGEQVISWSVDRNGNAVLERAGVVAMDDSGKIDWVVTKTDQNGDAIIDQNGHPNQWIIKDRVFHEKYEADPEKAGIFRPISEPQKFLLLKEPVHVTLRGTEWDVDAGGYINITKMDHLYSISARDFEDTYTIL